VKDPTFWILARASGLTAYVLLTLSVLAGLLVKSKPFGKAVRQPTVTDLHRFLALLGLGAIAIHGVTLVLDTTVKITPAALLVPGLVPYRPLWTALGVLAAELMVLIYVSFGLRKRIGVKSWRRLHYATYLVFASATVHGLAAGTDSARPWATWLYVGAIGAVSAATAWRVLTVAPAGAVRSRATRTSPVPVTDTPTGGTPR
jgi:sulfoxide reductase heme-binding subunit YedZ